MSAAANRHTNSKKADMREMLKTRRGREIGAGKPSNVALEEPG